MTPEMKIKLTGYGLEVYAITEMMIARAPLREKVKAAEAAAERTGFRATKIMADARAFANEAINENN